MGTVKAILTLVLTQYSSQYATASTSLKHPSRRLPKVTNSDDKPDPECQKKYEGKKDFKWPNDGECHESSLTPDEGCTDLKLPFLCPAKSFNKASKPVCVKSYSECTTVVPPCFKSNAFFTCETGKCCLGASECRGLKYKLKIQECADNLTRCEDGKCRMTCAEIKSSRCPIDSPYRCGYGQCTKSKYECTQFSYCLATTPFLCPNMTCVKTMSLCSDLHSFAHFDKPMTLEYSETYSSFDLSTIRWNKSATAFNATSFSVKVSASATIFSPPDESSPFRNQKLDKSATLTIRSISRSEVKDVENQLDKKGFTRIKNFYLIDTMVDSDGNISYDLPLDVSIRSAIIDISTKGRFDDNEAFGSSQSVNFRFNRLQKDEIEIDDQMEMLCLAIINDNNKWQCVSRKTKGSANKLKTLGQKTLSFNINKPGKYAIILNPKPIVLDKFNMPWPCYGLWHRSKFNIFMGMFFVLPVLIIGMSICGDLFKLAHDSNDVATDKENIVEKKRRLEDVIVDFVGQKIEEKVEIGVNYYVNPMHKSQGLDIGIFVIF